MPHRTTMNLIYWTASVFLTTAGMALSVYAMVVNAWIVALFVVVALGVWALIIRKPTYRDRLGRSIGSRRLLLWIVSGVVVNVLLLLLLDSANLFLEEFMLYMFAWFYLVVLGLCAAFLAAVVITVRALKVDTHRSMLD